MIRQVAEGPSLLSRPQTQNENNIRIYPLKIYYEKILPKSCKVLCSLYTMKAGGRPVSALSSATPRPVIVVQVWGIQV